LIVFIDFFLQQQYIPQIPTDRINNNNIDAEVLDKSVLVPFNNNEELASKFLNLLKEYIKILLAKIEYHTIFELHLDLFFQILQPI
jgi:hypothetical protein